MSKFVTEYPVTTSGITPILACPRRSIGTPPKFERRRYLGSERPNDVIPRSSGESQDT